MVPAARQIEQVARLHVRLEQDIALGGVEILAGRIAGRQRVHRGVGAVLVHRPRLLALGMDGEDVMQVVMALEGLHALEGAIDVRAHAGAERLFQDRRDIPHGRGDVMHPVGDHAGAHAEKRLHLGRVGAQRLVAVQRFDLVAIMLGQGRAVAHDQLHVRFDPVSVQIEDPVQPGPVQHRLPPALGAGDVDRFAVVMGGEKLRRAHRRDQIVKTLHGVLIMIAGSGVERAAGVRLLPSPAHRPARRTGPCRRPDCPARRAAGSRAAGPARPDRSGSAARPLWFPR